MIKCKNCGLKNSKESSFFRNDKYTIILEELGMEKLELTIEQKKKLAKEVGAIGPVIKLNLFGFAFGLTILIWIYDESMRIRFTIMIAVCIVAIAGCIIQIFRKRRMADGLFGGTMNVYKVIASITTIRGRSISAHADFTDNIYQNSPVLRRVSFANPYDAEKLYEKMTGEATKSGPRYDLENVEVIIVKKGDFERAFPPFVIE